MTAETIEERDEIRILDGKGYYSEQFLCRQVPQGPTAREEILEKIFLATNLIESVAARGLDSVIIDLSTDASGMPAQLAMRGFANVIAIPETERESGLLQRQVKAEGWKIRADLGTQDTFIEKELPRAERAQVVQFMDSSFGRFRSRATQAQAIRKSVSLLAPDGVLVLDLSNPFERIRSIPRAGTWFEDESSYRLARETIDPFTLEYTTTSITIDKQSGKQTVQSETGVLILLDSLLRLLEPHGLTVKNVFGGYEKDPFTLDSTRMIVIAGR